MEISFRTKKLQKTLNSGRELRKEFGQRMAERIQERLAVLDEAENLSRIPHTPPFRLHQLAGDRIKQFSVDLVHPFRLVFEAANEPLPTACDGGIDRERVTHIVILEITDTH